MNPLSSCAEVRQDEIVEAAGIFQHADVSVSLGLYFVRVPKVQNIQ